VAAGASRLAAMVTEQARGKSGRGNRGSWLAVARPAGPPVDVTVPPSLPPDVQRRITTLKALPDKDDPSHDWERQTILDDTLTAWGYHGAAGVETPKTIADLVGEVFRSGGFTHDFTRGMSPIVGFAVSRPPSEHCEEAQGHIGLLAKDDVFRAIQDYRLRHTPPLGVPPMYMGGWV